jgi:hypothetical protein
MRSSASASSSSLPRPTRHPAPTFNLTCNQIGYAARLLGTCQINTRTWLFSPCTKSPLALVCAPISCAFTPTTCFLSVILCRSLPHLRPQSPSCPVLTPAPGHAVRHHLRFVRLIACFALATTEQHCFFLQNPHSISPILTRPESYSRPN